MVRLLTSVIIISMFLLIYSCSKEGEERSKGPIDKMTDRAAEIAVEKIRAPIRQAEKARALVEDGMKEVDALLDDE